MLGIRQSNAIFTKLKVGLLIYFQPMSASPLVMYPANLAKRFSWLTSSTPIFIVEERSNIYIYIYAIWMCDFFMQVFYIAMAGSDCCLLL